MALTHLYTKANFKWWDLPRKRHLTEQKEFKLSPGIAFVFFELSLNFGIDSFLFFLFLGQTARHFVGQGLHSFLMHSIAYTYIYIYCIVERQSRQQQLTTLHTRQCFFFLFFSLTFYNWRHPLEKGSWRAKMRHFVKGRLFSGLFFLFVVEMMMRKHLEKKKVEGGV